MGSSIQARFTLSILFILALGIMTAVTQLESSALKGWSLFENDSLDSINTRSDLVSEAQALIEICQVDDYDDDLLRKCFLIVAENQRLFTHLVEFANANPQQPEYLELSRAYHAMVVSVAQKHEALWINKR